MRSAKDCAPVNCVRMKITPINAPAVRCSLAVVYAWTGQIDLAFAELDKAVDKPAGDAVVLQADVWRSALESGLGIAPE